MPRLIATLPLLLLAACQQPAQAPANEMAANASESMGSMDDNMVMTGDPDRDFATMMTGHHQSAITMAKTELESGKDPAMRALAERIIAAQEKEIAEMESYLAKAKPAS